MSSTLYQQLEATRDGYDEECEFHRFLLDGYTGSGGFAGKVKAPPVGPFGAASTMYTGVLSRLQKMEAVDTYLDPYPREEHVKFKLRADAVEYHNYVEAITDLKVGYINRREFTATQRPESVSEWRKNCDGNGTNWEELRAQHTLLAGVLGWRPVLIDARPAPVDTNGEPVIRNRAQAREAGLRPYPVPLVPANITDYAHDDAGQLTYAKIKTISKRRPTWDADVETVTTYTIWTTETWVKYEVAGTSQDPVQVGKGSNPFKAVPLVIYRHAPDPLVPVVGRSMNAAITQVARAHLNRLSEFNEHLRGQVFALLVISSKDDKPEHTIGAFNGLPIDPEARQPHAYIAPPATVASTYETRLENIVREIYRVARVEYTRSTGNVSSGEAHAYEFAQTNAALSDFAVHIAKAEMEVDWLVGRYYGEPEDVLRASTVTPPASFDVENLTVEIKAAFDLISGGVGPTATRLLKMRALRQVLRDMDADTVRVIEAELLAEEEQAAADRAAEEEAATLAAERAMAVEDDPEDPEDDPASEDTPEEE